jgi:hypothetical protein
VFDDEDGREREQVTSITRRIQDAEWLTEPSRTETHGPLVIASSSPAKLCSAHFAADHAPLPGNKVFYFDLQVNRSIHTYPAGTYTRTSDRK